MRDPRTPICTSDDDLFGDPWRQRANETLAVEAADLAELAELADQDPDAFDPSEWGVEL